MGTAVSAMESNHQEHLNISEKGSFDILLNDYTNLKDALVDDNSKNASEAGKTLLASLEKVSKSDYKEISEILDSIKENAEHIRDNVGKIDHQREHFALISKDFIDLINQTGTLKKLYLNFCPMYDDNKGANWLSETKEIENPFYGTEMLRCGTLKKEY